MKVEDIMMREVVTVGDKTSIRDLIKILHEQNITGVPVVGERQEIVGIVSEKDVIRAELSSLYRFERHEDLYDRFSPLYSQIESGSTETFSRLRLVEQIMTRDVVTVEPETSIKNVADILLSHGFHRLPVVNKKKRIVGIVTPMDMIKLLK